MHGVSRKYMHILRRGGNLSSNKLFSLAFIETLVITGISLLVIYTTESALYLLISVCIAPLLLLRTEESQGVGLSWYRHLIENYSGYLSYNKKNRNHDFRKFQYHASIAVLSLGIRVAATVFCTIRSPVSALRSIPSNWYSQCFEINFRTPLEPVPGAGSFPEPFDNPSSGNLVAKIAVKTICFFIGVVAAIIGVQLVAAVVGLACIGVYFLVLYIFSLIRSSVVDNVEYMLILLAVIPVIGAILLGLKLIKFVPNAISRFPAISYRWSLKSTFLVWSPLLWVLRPIQHNTTTVFEAMDELRHGIVNRLSVLFSFIVLGIFICKVWFFSIANNSAYGEVGKALIVDLYLWHIAALMNAIIAISMLIYADSELRKNKFRENYSIINFTKIISYGTLVRRVLSIYIMANSYHLLLASIEAVEVVNLHGRVWSYGE